MSRPGRCASFARRVLLVVLLLGSVWVPTAFADLAPGQSQYNQNTLPLGFFTPSYISGPLPAAYHNFLISSDFPYNYNGQNDGSFFGFVRSSIWANDAGQLAFTYIFNNLKPPPLPQNGFNLNPPLTDIVRATLNDPSNPWTFFRILNAGSDDSGLSTPVPGFFGQWANGDPFSIERKASDSSVAFNFDPFNSGTQLNSDSASTDVSALIWLTTDATRAAITNVALSDNGHVGVARAYGPNIRLFCPEPSTLMLGVTPVIASLAGVCVRAFRRRNA